MPEMPNAVKTSLTAWWASTDPNFQAILEAIYMEAPAAVSRAISGGQWVADSPEPGLAAQLGVDQAEVGAASSQQPMFDVEDMVATPFHAAPNQKVTFTWTEQNRSMVTVAEYHTDVYVSNPTGETIASARLTANNVAPNAAQQRSYEFAGAEAPGDYNLIAYVNSEGAEPGGIAGPQGFRSTVGTVFSIGADAVQAGTQDWQAWATGTQLISQSSVAGSVLESLERIDEGVNWVAAANDPELMDEKRFTGDEALVVSSAGAKLAAAVAMGRERGNMDGANSLTDPNLEHIRNAVQRVSGAAQAAQPDSPEKRKPLIDALQALTEVLPNA